MPFRTYAERGRAVTHVHDDMIVGDDAAREAAAEAGLPWMRGGMVEHSGAGLPIMEAKHSRGAQHHPRLMADSPIRKRLWAFIMQGEDLPYAGNRVDLDPTVRDARGFPVARVTYRPGPPRAGGLRPLRPEAAGHPEGDGGGVGAPSPRRRGRATPRPRRRSPRAGTTWEPCGWGPIRPPRWSDPTGRLHQLDNVMVADSSVFVTSTGYGPTLTLAALAARAAHLMT